MLIVYPSGIVYIGKAHCIFIVIRYIVIFSVTEPLNVHCSDYQHFLCLISQKNSAICVDSVFDMFSSGFFHVLAWRAIERDVLFVFKFPLLWFVKSIMSIQPQTLALVCYFDSYILITFLSNENPTPFLNVSAWQGILIYNDPNLELDGNYVQSFHSQKGINKLKGQNSNRITNKDTKTTTKITMNWSLC